MVCCCSICEQDVDNPFHRVLGNMPVTSGYSAGNVSERDFLRTEGDPAAAGYTIKEALSLLRSVVSVHSTFFFSK